MSEFKEYHNANHHDGDDTFDDQKYKMTNGEDFDDQFVQDCFDHFKAGQQSQQAKIDELQLSNHHLSVQVLDGNEHYDYLKKQCDEQQKKLDCCREENKAHLEKIDALQARVDEIVDLVRDNTPDYYLDNVIQDILKGNKDEN